MVLAVWQTDVPGIGAITTDVELGISGVCRGPIDMGGRGGEGGVVCLPEPD